MLLFYLSYGARPRTNSNNCTVARLHKTGLDVAGGPWRQTHRLLLLLRRRWRRLLLMLQRRLLMLLRWRLLLLLLRRRLLLMLLSLIHI